MAGGRTVWWAKDSAWWRREAIVELGEEFGPAGPVVIDWLACEAKAQNDGGKVRAGYRAIARGSFVDLVTVRDVVSKAVELGVLEDLEGDDRRFDCRLSGWQHDQERARGAARTAAWRDGAKDAAEPNERRAAAARRDAPSRAVTVRDAESLTGQDRKERPPLAPPVGGRKRSREEWEKQAVDWAKAAGIAGRRSVVLRAVEQASRYLPGGIESPEHFRSFVGQHFASSLSIRDAGVPS